MLPRISGFSILFATLAFSQGPLKIDPARERPKAANPSATAQTYPVKPKLTLGEALEMAERHNPRLRVASAAGEGAQAAITTARAYVNPEITLGGFGGQRALDASSVPGMLTGFVVSQRVELPSVRGARINAARLGLESAGHTLAETRLEVSAAVKQAFYQARRRAAEIDLAEGNVKLLEDLRRRIQVQVKVGEAARLELVRADAELATARIQLESGRLRLSAALAALGAAIGTRLEHDYELDAPLDPSPPLPVLEKAREMVFARHPAIASAEAEAARAAALLDLERAQRTPQPSVWADMFRQPDAAQYRVGISLSLPLWNRCEGQIAEAVAGRRQAAALADMRRLEITAALERAYAQYDVASQQVAMFQAGILREADAAVKAAEAAFRFGERGIIEVLDAQRVLRGARLDYLNAQFDRQAALIELEQLGVVDLDSRRP